MSRISWEKHLSVDRRIVRLLSASTYDDFPGAIRELVSNAYDADATDVHIEVNKKKDIIRVTDNGNGMTPEDFDFFLRIAGRQRGRPISQVFGRERIGQFGIGFLSMFPFGKRIHVASTARNTDVRFEATVPTEQFIREGQKTIDVEDISIPGFEVRDPKFLLEHGTVISISGLTEMAHRYLQAERNETRKARKGKQAHKTLRDLSGLDRLEWKLREDLPLDYPSNSPYKNAFSDLRPAGIAVTLNGETLLRSDPGSDILENKSWQYGDIECRYVIATDWQSLPYEVRGLKQRIHNVGIGDRTTFGLGLEGRAYSRLHWLTGEIRIVKGMDNLVSINRDKFVDSPDYDEFREYFRKRLSHFAFHVETVSEAQRDIKRQLSGSRAAEVGSKQEIIGRNIQTLKDKGFEVKSKPPFKLGNTLSPVNVDVKRRIVEVVDDKSALQDTIVIGKKKIPARFVKWDIDSEYPAVRRGGDGAIEINTNYTLFKSGRYGEVFKKILAMMLVISETKPSSHALIVEISKQLLKEFKDIR